jgi:biopolymer transport protein ExbB/TolQ
MGNHIKAWNALSRVLFLLVFAASLGVFYLTHTGESYADLIINLSFDLVAALFLVIYFAGCARPLVKVASALSRATDDILRFEDDTKALWERFIRESAPFENDRLDDRYGAYLRQLGVQHKQNPDTVNCAIDDYIDEELIYTTANKSFCDQLGGIMSGLGILFTFIGLVYGLRNFDASSVDVMQSSTQALMAGIKIAFLTSIFGLIYSLLFGLTYKKLLKDSLDTLYEFQDVYTEVVCPANDHGAENTLIRLQTEQNAALENFGKNVGEQVSQAIISLMQPTVAQLQDTITQYVSVSMEDQRAGMDKVVRYFLDSMNSSLGDIFAQLKDRTQELTRWEKDMTGSLSAMTAAMGKTSQDLETAQRCSVQIAQTMSAYTDSIQALTQAQAAVTERVNDLLTAYDNSQQQQAAYLQDLAAAGQAAAQNREQSLQVAQTVADIASQLGRNTESSAKTITAAGQTLSKSAQSIQDMAQKVTTDVGTAATRLERAADDLEGGLARSIVDSLAMVDDSLSKLSGAVNSVNASVAGVNQAMKALPKTTANINSDLRTTSKVIDTELKLLLKAVSDTEKILNKFNADLEQRIDR